MKHRIAIIHEINEQQVLFNKDFDSESQRHLILMQWFSEKHNGIVKVTAYYDDKETFEKVFEEIEELDKAIYLFNSVFLYL